MIHIRQNIIYITFYKRRFTKNSSHHHTKGVKMISKYWKRLKNKKITYSRKQMIKIVSYLDFDLVRDGKSHKIISSLIFMLNDRLVRYYSKIQIIVIEEIQY